MITIIFISSQSPQKNVFKKKNGEKESKNKGA